VEGIYKENLVSVILYGSGASGEFVDKRSNLNLLVVLKNTDPAVLKAASGLMRRLRYRMIKPVFFTEDYIASSTDVFPIEFMDMRENYALLYGRDILKDIHIDLKNLRFQCEHELKAKLIHIKQRYLMVNRDKTALKDLLFKSYTSVTHILRSALKLKGRQPAYKKEDVLKEISSEFKISPDVWGKILAAKNKRIELKSQDIEPLFFDFVRDLEKIAGAVNAF
jgi:predicted nucleotidyltransferase